MADEDWRVTATVYDEGLARGAVESVGEYQAAQDVQRRLGGRIAVSSDGPSIFLYAGTEDAAREAERVVREVLDQRKMDAEYALDRWHPIEEDWEDASVPMPQNAEQREAERRRRVAEETRESIESGQAGWEVRVQMPSRREAIELTRRLEEEGHEVARRWKYLVVGANNEDQAADLAERVKAEAPGATSVNAGSVPFVAFGQTDVGGVPVLPAD